MAQFTHLLFSKVAFASFLGISAFAFLNVYRPRYSTFFYFANVKRI